MDSSSNDFIMITPTRYAVFSRFLSNFDKLIDMISILR